MLIKWLEDYSFSTIAIISLILVAFVAILVAVFHWLNR